MCERERERKTGLGKEPERQQGTDKGPERTMSIERYSYIEINTQRQKLKWGTGRHMWVLGREKNRKSQRNRQ